MTDKKHTPSYTAEFIPLGHFARAAFGFFANIVLITAATVLPTGHCLEAGLFVFQPAGLVSARRA